LTIAEEPCPALKIDLSNVTEFFVILFISMIEGIA